MKNLPDDVNDKHINDHFGRERQLRTCSECAEDFHPEDDEDVCPVCVEFFDDVLDDMDEEPPYVAPDGSC